MDTIQQPTLDTCDIAIQTFELIPEFSLLPLEDTFDFLRESAKRYTNEQINVDGRTHRSESIIALTGNEDELDDAESSIPKVQKQVCLFKDFFLLEFESSKPLI